MDPLTGQPAETDALRRVPESGGIGFPKEHLPV